MVTFLGGITSVDDSGTLRVWECCNVDWRTFLLISIGGIGDEHFSSEWFLVLAITKWVEGLIGFFRV